VPRHAATSRTARAAPCLAVRATRRPRHRAFPRHACRGRLEVLPLASRAGPCTASDGPGGRLTERRSPRCPFPARRTTAAKPPSFGKHARHLQIDATLPRALEHHRCLLPVRRREVSGATGVDNARLRAAHSRATCRPFPSPYWSGRRRSLTCSDPAHAGASGPAAGAGQRGRPPLRSCLVPFLGPKPS
jgi:hypothetical protein